MAKDKELMVKDMEEKNAKMSEINEALVNANKMMEETNAKVATMEEEMNGYKEKYEAMMAEKNAAEEEAEKNSVVVSHEKIRYSFLKDGKWSRLCVLIDSSLEDEKVFIPDVRLKELTGGSLKTVEDLRVAKKMAAKQATSFIFSKDTLNQIIKSCSVQEYKDLLHSLHLYGRIDLYIIGNRDSGLVAMNAAIPFSFKVEEDRSLSMGRILIRIDGPSLIPEEIYNLILKIIDSMNAVLCEIVPGLRVELIDMGKQMMKSGTEGVNIELVSVRNGHKIPLWYESEGIKKIISMVQEQVSGL